MIKPIDSNKRNGERFSKTFCEFFAGIGLVRAGLEPSGWRCVYANDVDPKKKELYENRFGIDDRFYLGDVWNTSEVLDRIVERPFLATASFPCVDLSPAGYRRGFEGEHSSTFFGFVEILARLGERGPKLILLENVTGFLTSKNGADFKAAIRSLSELGYAIDAFTLDAKYFVPQSRPRVFVVGAARDLEVPGAIRSNATDWFGVGFDRAIERADAAIRPRRIVPLLRSIDPPPELIAFDIPIPNAKIAPLVELIDLDLNQKWWDEAQVQKHYLMMNDKHRAIVDRMIAAGESFVGTIFRRKRGGSTRAEVRFDGLAGCLRTPRGGSARQIVVAIDRGVLRMRWMSPREYARLQGAGDYPLVENEVQNLFGFGDAVCTPVIRYIDRYILSPVFDRRANPLEPTLAGGDSDQRVNDPVISA